MMNLEQIPKQNPFKRPNSDYFEKLSDEIQHKIKLEEQQTHKRVSISKWKYVQYVVACSLIVAVTTLFFWNQFDKQTSQNDSFADISDEVLYSYLESSNMATEELFENLEQESIAIQWESDIQLDRLPSYWTDTVEDDEDGFLF